MRKTGLLIAAVALAMLAGCKTTEEADKAIKSRFIGQPSDSFFSQYGAPLSSFALNNGSVVYRWRGGETVRHIPAQYKTVETRPAGTSLGESKTTTHTSQPNANTTVTETSTTSWSIGTPAGKEQVLVRPARDEQLFCEAQITVDPKGIITNVQATRDTTGEGFALSRCAEVFKVE